jgi:vacuolar-type H+-ATPase subunit I/STV1
VVTHHAAFDGRGVVAHDAGMTIRRDLDSLVDELEPEYADASNSAGQARVVATAALRSAFLLADALDALTQQVTDLNGTDHQLVNELRTEIADLRLKIEHLRVTTKRTRR